MSNLKVEVMGLGYIGLPTAALIASRAFKVQGVDTNPKVIKKINQGEIHIVEPDLGGLVKYVVDLGFLKASLKPSKADVFLIAVPTPFKKNHEPDITYVKSATNMIIPMLTPGNLVIIESTCPIGTTEKMRDLILSRRPELKNKLYIAYCPERVLPGKIFYELVYNDRVIGGIDQPSTEKAAEFYSFFVKGNLHKTNARTAEMCKLSENAYRDLNIAFANELSILCDKFGIDVWELIQLTNKHPRVNILKPGCGVGGHCIAVDPWFLIHAGAQDATLIKMARLRNDSKTDWVIDKIKNTARAFEKKNHKKAIIACMGLTYKPDTDDLRESPALAITKTLMAERYRIFAVEPNIKNYQDFKIVDYKAAIEEADIIALLVAHNEFKNISFTNNKVVLDFCGIRNS
jgi:UDP-N-acetyl-D-mannosaminuronic acid dehydrogenase